MPRVLEWLDETSPDVALLQEIKTVPEEFPSLEINGLGYDIAMHGQKSYNGVAILSKTPIENVKMGLPGDDTDEQARYIEATVNDLRVASIYLPNGNPTDTDKFPYKLSWMDRLVNYVRDDLLPQERPFLLGGDYNIVPTDDDVYDPKGWLAMRYAGRNPARGSGQS